MTTIPFNKLCRTCGFLSSDQSVCNRQKIKVNSNEDFCAWHIPKNNSVCVVCKNPIANDAIILEPNIPICANCYNAYYGRCEACRHYQEGCALQNDRTEPPIINQTVRQGFMTIQQQVRNPKLVNRHCVKCQCGIDKQCLRDGHGAGCPNWTLLV